jgi:putative ABC transport system substrate-binding protein
LTPRPLASAAGSIVPRYDGVIAITREDVMSRRSSGASQLCRALLIAAVSSIASVQAVAQPAPKPLHVGILSSGSREVRGDNEAALLERLRELGYVEGRNLTIERRYGASRIKDNAADLAGMHLDAVMTTCTPSTRVMKEASSSTPIVMAAVSDPIRQGIIDSLSKPGRNVTGTSSQAEDLLAKRLELLIAVLPKSPVVAVVANANNPVHALAWQTMQGLARGLDVELVKAEIDSPDELPAAIEAASRAKATAMFVLPDDPLFFNRRAQLVAIAASHRMADFYWERQFVEGGGFMSYGEDLRASYRAVAAYIDKIKKGASPSALPVSQPTRFELIINAGTARSLNLAIPPSVAARADQVL